MGFGSVIGLAEQLENVTTCNYSTVTNSHTLQIATEQSVFCGFASRCLVTAPNAGFPLTLGSLTIPVPQLLTATAHKDKWSLGRCSSLAD
jgi:hypothetical protein